MLARFKVVARTSRHFHSTAIAHEHKLNDVIISKTRNIGIIAHIDAGKTTTTERMLFYSGKTQRIGNVDEGDTVTDYLPSERQRGITIQLAAITIPWNNNKINIIDTPGHADFTFEVIRSLRVLDGAVTILDAVAGVEAQTEKVWKQADALKIPRIAYVNKMDRPGAGFSRTVKEIVQKLQTRVVLVTIPYFINSADNDPVFSGVIDVLHKKLLVWDPKENTGKTISVVDVEQKKDEYPEIYEMIVKSRESMIETLGEQDEAIIDSFLENNEDYMKIPVSVLHESIRNATISNVVTPVFCGSSFKNIGVQPMMDGVINYLPSPLQIPLPEIHSSSSKLLKVKNQKKKEVVISDLNVRSTRNPETGLVINDNPNLTVAFAFKVMSHATRGVMTFFRVYSGRLQSNTFVVNTRTGKKLLIKKLMIMHGDEPDEVKHLGSGSIGVITGYEDDIATGDTLVSHGPIKKNFSEMESNIKLLPIEIPPTLFTSGIEPLTAGDEAYMNQCIKALIREDPSLKVTVDEELGQTVLGGMGELHLDIVRERLVRDMKAKVRLRDVAVAFKEGLFKSPHKQLTFPVNGAVSVTIELDSFEGSAFESLFADEEGALVFELDNNIVILGSDATPGHVLEAIEERRWKSEHSLEDLQETLVQGCLTGLQLSGPIFGLPLHSTVVRIISWTFPVEEKEKTNVSELLNVTRKAISDYVQTYSDSFGILEPIMHTKVYINSDHLGEVSHDLTHRCQAIITLIEDESGQNLDSQTWANEESDRIYLPPDYTLGSSISGEDLKNKKIIVAETPLREMIGYLSRLRSITQGRATFDMTYVGLRRANKARFDAIAKDMSI